VEELVRVINSVCDALREEEMLRGKEEDACARTLRLERYMSPNFFGLFVEKEKESLLKRLSADLCQGAELRTNIRSFNYLVLPWKPVLGIRIPMFLDLPDPDPLVREVWIRIRLRIRILPFSNKGVERTDIMPAK
jgi:hypothetical protein